MLLMVLVTQMQGLPTIGRAPLETANVPTYWFQMNAEKTEASLHLGIPGKREESRFIRTFATTVELDEKTSLSDDFSIVIAKNPVQTYNLTQNCFLRIDGGEVSRAPVDSQSPLPTNVQPLGSCVSFSTEDATFLDNLIFPDAGEIRFYGEAS